MSSFCFGRKITVDQHIFLLILDVYKIFAKKTNKNHEIKFRLLISFEIKITFNSHGTVGISFGSLEIINYYPKAMQ
jgi:hypothetical protein